MTPAEQAATVRRALSFNDAALTRRQRSDANSALDALVARCEEAERNLRTEMEFGERWRKERLAAEREANGWHQQVAHRDARVALLETALREQREFLLHCKRQLEGHPIEADIEALLARAALEGGTPAPKGGTP